MNKENLCYTCTKLFELKKENNDLVSGFSKCLVSDNIFDIKDSVTECNHYNGIIREGELDPNPALVNLDNPFE